MRVPNAGPVHGVDSLQRCANSEIYNRGAKLRAMMRIECKQAKHLSCKTEACPYKFQTTDRINNTQSQTEELCTVRENTKTKSLCTITQRNTPTSW